MRFDILTLFPQIFTGYQSQSILHRAIEKRQVQMHVHDIRDWTSDRHQKVDDRPYGGGPGMILMVEPVVLCAREIAGLTEKPPLTVLLSPSGRRLDQPLIEELAIEPRMMLLCGRYEGFDQRVSDILQPMEVSIGDYILNGGEVAAMVLINALVRMIPGVLGDEYSNWDDSFSRGNRLLEYPQYTRPREFEGYPVPEVLLSGNHEQIRQWRNKKSLEKTANRRSDLLK